MVKNQQLLIYATLFSVAAHLILLLYLMEFNWSHSSAEQENHSIKISLIDEITAANSSLRKTPEKIQNKSPKINVLSKNHQTVEPSLKNKTTHNEKLIPNTKKKKSKTITPSKKSGLTIYSELSTTAEKFAKQKEGNSGDFSFNPDIENKLEHLSEKKEERKKLNEQRRFIKSNRYHEFNAIGDQAMVRIENNCYSVQKENPLDEFDNPIMQSMGDCRKKKNMVFKSYAPHIIKQRQAAKGDQNYQP